MQKVYTLPDLPAAPYSEVQALAKRLIEYADFSTLVPLFDLLREQSRSSDLEKLRSAVGDFTIYVNSRSNFPVDYWGDWVGPLIQVFLFDLWPVVGVSSYLSSLERIDPVEYQTQLYTATESIPSGSAVRVDRRQRTVSLFPQGQEQQ